VGDNAAVKIIGNELRRAEGFVDLISHADHIAQILAICPAPERMAAVLAAV
jgi:hypothetical protein